eukprot:7198259-Pyramimonas_sp.AAC.1
MDLHAEHSCKSAVPLLDLVTARRDPCLNGRTGRLEVGSRATHVSTYCPAALRLHHWLRQEIEVGTIRRRALLGFQTAQAGSGLDCPTEPTKRTENEL